jgi:hypothetical protein
MSDASNTDFPTVVLVHGAFADASSWTGVIERLQAKGVSVTAPANPLRGIAADTATRSMAERAGAKTTEVDGSHVIMVSQPEAVTNVILEAVAAVTGVPVGA